VEVARLMRHDGMRLAVSTQSPKTLAPELLELLTIGVIHRFHARDWFEYLKKKLPLAEEHFQDIMELRPGSALVFAAHHRIGGTEKRAGDHEQGQEQKKSTGCIFPMQIRARMTSDCGNSVRNAV
jgi:hypothetical protein